MIKYLIALQLLSVGLVLAAPSLTDEPPSAVLSGGQERPKCSHGDHPHHHAKKPKYYTEHCQKLATSKQVDNCLIALTGDGIYWIKEADEIVVGLGDAFKHVLLRDLKEIGQNYIDVPRKIGRHGSERVRIAQLLIPAPQQAQALNKAYRQFWDDIRAADSDYKIDNLSQLSSAKMSQLARDKCESYLTKFEPLQQTIERTVEAANRDYVNMALKTNKYLLRVLDGYYFCKFAKSNKYGHPI